VVFVHGTMDRGLAFRRVCEHLAGWERIGYDRRGWGWRTPAARTADRTVLLADHVADLVEILSPLHRPVVVGHSYGALVALTAAAALPPKSLRVVLAFEPPIRWLPWWPVEAPWEQAVRAAARSGGQAVAGALIKAVTGLPPQRTGRSAQDLEVDGMTAFAEMSDPTLTVPSFEPTALATPVLVAAGGISLAHHRVVSRRLAELLPHGRFAEIPGSGHLPHLSHPPEFARLIKQATCPDAADRNAHTATPSED
jgi:pimeloyl-ACP methyl ester carboxylesterase